MLWPHCCHPHPFPLAPASATRASLPVLKHIRRIPTSGPLQYLFPLQGVPSPDSCMAHSLTFAKSLQQCHLYSEDLPDHPFKNCKLPLLVPLYPRSCLMSLQSISHRRHTLSFAFCVFLVCLCLLEHQLHEGLDLAFTPQHLQHCLAHSKGVITIFE